MALREPRRHLFQQVLDHVLALLQIDQQIVRTRQKDVFGVDDGDLVRLIETLGNAVKVHGTIVRNDADLCARIARYRFQIFAQQFAHRFQVAGLLRDQRHIQQEQIDGRLRRTQHVLGWSDEFDGARLDFGTTRHIAVRLAHRIVVELVGHCSKGEQRDRRLVIRAQAMLRCDRLTFIDSITQIAFPLFAIDEVHKRIDVRAARAATNYRRTLDYGKVL